MTLEMQRVTLYSVEQRRFASDVIDQAKEAGLSPQNATLAIGLAFVFMYMQDDSQADLARLAMHRFIDKVVDDWQGKVTVQEGTA